MAPFPPLLLILLSIAESIHSTASLPGAPKLWRSWTDGMEPSLEREQVNITSVAGRTVALPCRVRNLQDKTVSWIRGRDLTVLAVETTTYAGDPRFSVKHAPNSDDWVLLLQGVTKKDEGSYDCQVNTYPKISTKVFLKVVSKEAQQFFFDRPISDTGMTSLEGGAWRELSEDPNHSGSQDSDESFGVRLLIKGNARVRVRIGESLELTCEATRNRGRGSHFLFKRAEERILRWTLDDVPIEILFPEWKVNVRETWTTFGIESELRLNSVTTADAGKISCVAPQAIAATVEFDVEERNSPKQHYLGLSNSKNKHGHHYTHPMTSAVSGAAVKVSNSKFAILCAAVMVLFTLTNIAVCFHYLRKS